MGFVENKSGWNRCFKGRLAKKQVRGTMIELKTFNMKVLDYDDYLI